MDRFNIIKYLSKKFARTHLLISSVFFIVLCIALFFDRYVILSAFYTTPTVSSIFETKTYFDENKRVINLKVSELFDIGYEIEEITTENGVEKSRTTKSYYCIAPFDDGIILVELPYSYKNNPKYTDVILKGILQNPDPSKDYHKEVYTYLSQIIIESYDVSIEEAKQIISPVFLNVGELTKFKYVFISFCIVLSIIMLFLMIKFLRVLFNYTNSSIYKSLDEYGYAEDIEDQIIDEYDDGVILDCSYGCILESFIVFNKVYLMEDLLWIYSRTRTYNGIVSGHEIVLNFTNGKTTAITVKDPKDLKDALVYIANNYPVFIGYYDEYIDLFKKKNLDSFLDLLDQYKQKFYSNNTLD